jgi:hypothetical protein
MKFTWASNALIDDRETTKDFSGKSHPFFKSLSTFT